MGDSDPPYFVGGWARHDWGALCGSGVAVVDAVATVERLMPTFPKPRPILHDRVADKRAQEAKRRAFQRAVWTRDDGVCVYCGRIVRHLLALSPARGECHHVKPVSTYPELRYVVANAVLLCLTCHQRAQRHEITVEAPR